MQDINEIVESLAQGGVVLLSTDTVYGLAVKPDIAVAVEKIYTLKSRPQHMFLPIMVSSISFLEELGLDVNENAKKVLFSKLVPGAITLVLGFDAKKSRPNWLKGRDEIAVRIPNDERLLKVLENAGPLLVTSANKHGNPSTPNNIPDILKELNGTPDYTTVGSVVKEIPSTIINFRKNPPQVEREGYISSKQIFELLKNDNE